MNEYATVIPTAINNLKSAARFRPADMIDWARLVKPLRQNGGMESFDLYQLAFHMFTRLPFDYRPTRAGAGLPLSPWAPEGTAEPSVGLFADSPEHLSGVARTLQNWNRIAAGRDLPFRVHSAGDQPVIPDAACFPRVGTFRLHAYDGLSIHIPQIGDVLNYARRSRFDVIHISTPGPMGLIGLLAARERNLRTVSTFHTHFPSYVARLTGDRTLEDVCWAFMRWFYNQMDRVAAPTTSIREELMEHGIEADKIAVVGRGVDRDTFSPRYRDESLRLSWGKAGVTNLLYVGRLSKEKNLACLAESFRELAARRSDVRLVFVGDGPYQQELMRTLAGLPVVFAGVQSGEDLSRHYASGDLFLFPSETDTLGNVVLEAQASGLPVIVSSGGGPKDCVQDGVSGLVLPVMSPHTLAHAVESILADPARCTRMGIAARRHTRRFTHDAAFDAFWQLHRF